MFEKAIFGNLFYNKEYATKVFPYLDKDDFDTLEDKALFTFYSKYVEKYNTIPSVVEVINEVASSNINDETVLCGIEKTLSHINSEKENYLNVNQEWLRDKTQKWIKDRRIEVALQKSISIYQDAFTGKGKMLPESIPDLLEKAVNFSFNIDIGVNALDINSALSTYDELQDEKNKISFNIDILNYVTGGGVDRKKLTAFLAGTNVGKSFIMTAFGCDFARRGYNVLYCTAEDSEHSIFSRIAANYTGLRSYDLFKLPKEVFKRKYENAIKDIPGNLIVRYMEGCTTKDIEKVCSEIKNTEGWTPDVICIDFIDYFNSYRFRQGSIADHNYPKKVAEEFQALAMKLNCQVMTGVQGNRNAQDNEDLTLKDIADSLGLAKVCKLMFGIVSTESMQRAGYMKFIQLKSKQMKGEEYEHIQEFKVGANIAMQTLFSIPQDFEVKVSNDKKKEKIKKSIDEVKEKKEVKEVNDDSDNPPWDTEEEKKEKKSKRKTVSNLESLI